MLIKLSNDYLYDLKVPCYYLQVTHERTLDKPFRCIMHYESFIKGITHPNITCEGCPNFIDDSNSWTHDTIKDNE